MAKSNAGRPTKMTDEVIRLLLDAYSWGCTDREACCFAGIVPSTLYKYCEENPEFTERKETLKDQPVMKARKIIKAALDDSDLNTANRVVDRKEGQKIKAELTGADGGPIETKMTFNFIPVGGKSE